MIKKSVYYLNFLRIKCLKEDFIKLTKEMPVQPKKKIRVIKVKSDYPVNDFYTPSFPAMPRLYLELLENKQKVKTELRNREFIPKGNSRFTGPSIDEARMTAQKEMSTELKMNFGEDTNNNVKRSPTESQPKFSPRSFSKPAAKEDQVVDITTLDEDKIKQLSEKKSEEQAQGSIKPSFKERLRQRLKQRDQQDSDSDKDYRSLDSSGLKEKYRNKFRHGTGDQLSGRSEDRRDERSDDRREDRKEERSDDRSDDRREERKEDVDVKKPAVAMGLASLLRGETKKETSEVKTPIVEEPKIQKVEEHFQQDGIKMPPSLEQINKGQVQVDANGVRNIEFTSQAEDDVLKRKRDLLNKIKILKKTNRNPNILIPDFTELTDLQTLEREHDHYEKILRVEQNVETYSKVLKYGLLGLEWVLIEFLKFEDIDGFAKQQIANMHQYEPLLMEISEKNYMPDTKSWPVELRLLFTVLMNGAGFVMMKMFFKNIGPKSQSSVPQQQVPPNTTPIYSTGRQEARPKMRGPQFDFDELETKKTN